MTDFIYELIVIAIVTLGVFAIVALRDMITIQRYYNTFYITPSVKLFYEWGYYVSLDLAFLKWHISITLYDKPLWWGGNNDNPDTNTTTGENTNATDKITTITDETTS
jgi:hypothetical protein